MNYVSNFRRWKWPTAKPTPISYCLSPGGRESFRELHAFKWKVSDHLEFDLSSIYLFWPVPLLYSSRKANEWGEGRPLPCGLESSTWAVRVVVVVSRRAWASAAHAPRASMVTSPIDASAASCSSPIASLWGLDLGCKSHECSPTRSSSWLQCS